MGPIMDIGRRDAGGVVSVGDMMVFDQDHGIHLVKLCHTEGLVQVRGLVSGVCSRQMPLDVQVVKQSPSGVLEVCLPVTVTCHTAHTGFDFQQLVEVWIGVEWVTHGTLSAGVRSIVDYVALMSVGDSCQPLLQVFLYVLIAACMMQIRVLVRDCAALARGDGFVQPQIGQSARLTGFRDGMVSMDLQTEWHSWRLMSWWVGCGPCLGTVGVTEWLLQQGCLKGQGLISDICKWDPWDVNALSLDQRECKEFGVHDGTCPRYMLSADGVAPTALHAWGLQLKACPGGWSDFGLCARRLHEQDLFGLMVRSVPERVRWFGRVLWEVLWFAGISLVSPRYCPVSHLICMYASCMGFPLSEEQLCAADWWVSQFSKVPFRRQSKELDHLPVPASALVQ